MGTATSGDRIEVSDGPELWVTGGVTVTTMGESHLVVCDPGQLTSDSPASKER